jgi:hypothetical protein
MKKKHNSKLSGFTPNKGWDVLIRDERWPHINFRYNISLKGINYNSARLLAEKKHKERNFNDLEIERLNSKDKAIVNNIIETTDKILSGEADLVGMLLSGKLDKIFK